jgi:hypothetical protein
LSHKGSCVADVEVGLRPGVVTHNYNPSYPEAEKERTAVQDQTKPKILKTPSQLINARCSGTRLVFSATGREMGGSWSMPAQA